MQVIVEHGNQSLHYLSDNDKVIINNLLYKYINELGKHWVSSGEPWSVITQSVVDVAINYMYSVPNFYLLRDELTNEPVGFILYCDETTPSNQISVDVCELYVSEPYRGLGYGKYLLNLVITHAKSIGAVGMTLNVSESNPANILYNSAGFKPASTRKVLVL